MSYCYKYEYENSCDEKCPGYSNPEVCLNNVGHKTRDRKFAEAINFFMKVGVDAKEHHQGLEINGKFVFSPKSFKWRAIAKNKWYYSKGHEDFYNRFLNK